MAPEPLPPGRSVRLEAARVLARAFLDSPLSHVVFARLSLARRQAKLERMFGSRVAVASRYGRAMVVRSGERASAVLLAYPPGAFPLSAGAWVRGALGAATLGPRYTWRLWDVDTFFAEHHLSEPHWYIEFLGVVPECQRRGLGARLVEQVARLADDAGLPCFLSTEKPENIGFYRRFGYVVIAEAPSPNKVRFWFMRRPPAARPAVG